jgi:hypothetical protein
MKLMKLDAWRRARFAEPLPPMRTCQDWAATGAIPAVKRGKTWFVDIEREARQSGLDQLDEILNGTKKAS